MNIDNLVRMANRIGDFFSAMPDRDQALQDIATHIQKFWEPRMRVQLLAFLQEHPDGQASEVQLAPIVLTAVTQYRDRLQPATMPTSPAP